MYYDIIIIGGGAAGMCTAIKSKNKNNSVLIIDHNNRVGKKILSTGNGKCNLTNTYCKVDLFDKNPEGIYPYYPYENKAFAESVIRRFDCDNTIEWFRSLGILCTNKNGYIYPLSEQASSVLDVLRLELTARGVDVLTDYQPLNIVRKNGIFNIDSYYSCKNLVIATGGMAAEKSGSDGSGYNIAASFGHTVSKPLPALCGLMCKGTVFRTLQKIRSDCRLKLYDEDPKIPYLTSYGNVQFNSYGLSGIPAMQISSYAARLLDDSYCEYMIKSRKRSSDPQKRNAKKLYVDIEFLPDLSFEDISLFVAGKIKNADARHKQMLPCSWLLTGILNKKIIDVIFKEMDLDPALPLEKAMKDFRASKQYSYGKVCGKKFDELNDELIFGARLAGVIKHFTVEVSGVCGFNEAQVTAGGISVDEIDPDTMCSKLVQGLYFAGEIIDIDGICGGYNLQWAWATADAAAKAISKQ